MIGGKQMKLAIVTDSTAYIPQELLEKNNIFIVPLTVNFGEESFREEQDITAEKFYEKMRNTKELPTTSQPAIGDFLDLFKQLSVDYDEVVTIHLSGNFSGTFAAAKSAANQTENIKVYPFDTQLSAMPQGLFVLAAAELKDEGKTGEEIIAYLDAMKLKTRAYFMVDDLTNLHKGGRLNSAQALLGSLLNVKPVLHIVDGYIVPYEKIRTRKKAVKRIMDMLEQATKDEVVRKVVFIHGNNEPAAEELRAQYVEKYPGIETIISCFGPVIATHLGENSIGVSWYTE